ncbi:DUF349 domain-containing protein [Nonlabens spongiae]|nr:DUF349 domain-containing protein [Nonlabens spongiae]
MSQNDNLSQKADGKQEENDRQKDLLENSIVETSENAQKAPKEDNIQTGKEDEAVVAGDNKKKEVAEDASTTHEDAIVTEKTNVENAEDSIVDVDDAAEAGLENKELNVVSETSNKKDKEISIPKKDYTKMNPEGLIIELRQMMQEYPINSFRDEAESIKKEFEKQDQAQEKADKVAFDKANPPSDDLLAPEFQYDDKLRKEFNDLHRLYRKQKGEYQREKRKQEEKNLEVKREVIEKMKALIDEEENIGTTFKKFHELQDIWKATGNIPHDAYNITWEDYRLAVQNFYDYIDLSKELRDKDFERNLEFKKKIIARAVELNDEENIHKALRELQELHRMWKEDAGPVARELRDPIWDEFSAATKAIHDRRQAYYEEREKEAEKNQTIKENIVAEIKKITAAGANSHKEWQERLEEINVLKELFQKTGRAPKAVNNEIWEGYRNATRDFNRAKNNFYKEIKKEQQKNLEAKMKLVEIAEEHQDSENFAEGLEIMKRIQAEWKTIGHVPRKDSDKIWKRFKKACNAFFDKKSAQRNKDSKEETANYEAKLKIYDKLKTLIPDGDQDAMKESIENVMEEWNKVGRVPYSKRQIQDKFEKLVKAKFKAAGLSEEDAEMMKYQNKLNRLEDGSERDFKNERFYLKKRREEIKNEMIQLENNLQFINAKDDKNPFLVQQRKNIANLEKELSVIKEKQKQINILERQVNKEDEVSETKESTES